MIIVAKIMFIILGVLGLIFNAVLQLKNKEEDKYKAARYTAVMILSILLIVFGYFLPLN